MFIKGVEAPKWMDASGAVELWITAEWSHESGRAWCPDIPSSWELRLRLWVPGEDTSHCRSYASSVPTERAWPLFWLWKSAGSGEWWGSEQMRESSGAETLSQFLWSEIRFFCSYTEHLLKILVEHVCVQLSKL